MPSLGTLERLAGALEVPVYRFFYHGDKPPKPATNGHSNGNGNGNGSGNASPSDNDPLTGQLLRLVSRIGKTDQQLLLATALKMTRSEERRVGKECRL